jgi:glutamyl-tRNA synthetase/glutamyl-Q tRNA(Asp) synthetase
VQCPAEQCGDLLLRERGGSFTYQFCVVVDDIHDGIDLVIRGQDLLDSTGRQLQLAKLMGSSRTIAYGHHPVLRDDQGNKLSKRQRSDSIAAMRQAGATAQQVLGRAAMLMGLQDSDLPRELTEFRAEVQQNG